MTSARLQSCRHYGDTKVKAPMQAPENRKGYENVSFFKGVLVQTCHKSF